MNRFKLKEMSPGVRYVVTKGGKLLKEGQSVRLVGDLGRPFLFVEDSGVLVYDKWKRLQNRVSIDIEYYRHVVKALEFISIEYKNMAREQCF